MTVGYLVFQLQRAVLSSKLKDSHMNWVSEEPFYTSGKNAQFAILDGVYQPAISMTVDWLLLPKLMHAFLAPCLAIERAEQERNVDVWRRQHADMGWSRAFANTNGPQSCCQSRRALYPGLTMFKVDCMAHAGREGV